MKTTLRWLFPVFALALTLVAASLYLPRSGSASDHQDSPLTVGRPGADITDVYVFPAADPNKVALAMDIHPLIPAGLGHTVFLDPGVMYQFKIDTNGDYREDKVIQFRVTGDGGGQVQMYGPTAPAAAGTRSQWEGSPQSFAFNHPSHLAGGVMAFAGPRQDPFYFDLAQLIKIVPDRSAKYHAAGAFVPAPSASCFRAPGVGFLRDFNVISIVVELPRAMLAGPGGRLGLIHVYATTSVVENGRWTQVERLARPAIKEAFQPFDGHDRTNRSAPWADPTLPHDIIAFMTSKHGANRSMALAKAVEKTLIPDEIEVNLAYNGPARYLGVETNGKSGLPVGIVRLVPGPGIQGIKKALGDPYRQFGGRDPSSPVMDLSLGIIFGSLGQKVGLAAEDSRETACLTSDNVDAGKRGVSNSFPYIGNPI